MTGTPHKTYVPGMHTGKRTSVLKMADQCIREWEMRKQAARKGKNAEKTIENTRYICFSRKIGVGALEIAEILAEKMNIKAVDREILEHIVKNRSLPANVLDDFDERYPGMIRNFTSLMFGNKAFTMGDYLRNLTTAVLQIAETGPTIFVGRATHLILPRENVLAVRLICSRANRVKRLTGLLNISDAEAEKILDEEDRLQKEFFKKNFNKKDARAYEFDLVINRDYIHDAHQVADIVQYAQTLKFGGL